MKVLGIIPARGGSKGIPGKNIKLLGGKPLLVYTIEEALKSNCLDYLLVSTDNSDIASISKQAGLEVPFLRPPEFAQDQSSSVDLVLHTLDFLEKEKLYFDAICLLQPTVPFRKGTFIDEAIAHFSSKNYDSLISVRPVPHQFNPYWVFEQENDHLVRSKGGPSIIKRRQELPDAFYRDGSIYLTKTEVIKNRRSFFGVKLGYVVSENPDYVNIDTWKDWEQAEVIVKNHIINVKNK